VYHKKTKSKKSILKLCFFLFLLFLFRPTYTPAIKGDKSVNKIETLTIGGTKQSLLIRGSNVNNPVILILHGGPGLAQICYARKYQQELEQDFVVVNWDQRGSGQSYRFFMDTKKLTKEQILEDSNELINYLCETFKQEKIIVIGHSWGSELGMDLVSKNSSKIAAYIGVGQVINQKEGERISYEYALELAKQYNDTNAIEELEEIGYPPYENVIDATLKKEKVLKKYSPLKSDVNVTMDIIKGCLYAPEYNGIDSLKYIIGNKISAETLWGKNPDYNLIEEVNKVDIPVYFCAGRYDYTTPSELVETFYKNLDAPYKELIWFEDSAHYPQYNEHEKFYEVLLKVKERMEMEPK
jgi:L-proline amide hydrolase